MANGDTTLSRVGQVEAAGSATALFLKKFSGEILTSFDEKNIMKPLHMVRTIKSGKSAQFPVTGVAASRYHTPGQNIQDSGNSYIQDIHKAEREIFIDGLLTSVTTLSQLDEAMNHYDIRSIYAEEIAQELATRFDSAVIKTVVAAARASAILSTQEPNRVGSVFDASQGQFIDESGYTDPGDTTTVLSGAQLTAAFFAAARRMDERNVPKDGRVAVLPPEEYYKLVTGGAAATPYQIAIANSASNKDVGGSGGIDSGMVPQIAGISIFSSNHVPQTDLSSATGDDTDGSGQIVNDPFGAGAGYNADFRRTKGIIFSKQAVGTTKLLDLATEMEWKIELQAHLFVAKYAMGHGILRGECAIELANSETS